MNGKLSLREIKKARSKISIFKACLDLVGEQSFREVRLEEICERAEISKVTFFKFFPRKEDLLVYFMRLWLDNRILDLHQYKYRGMDAIRFLLRDVAHGSQGRPRLMLSLISFLAEERMHPEMPVMSEAEIQLLYPGKESLIEPAAPNLGDLFYRFIKEAQEDGDVRADRTVDELVKMLFSIFYGGYLTAHLYQEKDIMQVYELHLRTLLS